MNHTNTITPRWCFLIVAFIAALSGISRGAAYSPGDEITLTRDEPMLFRDKVFRRGRAGEEFAVLTHRADLKKVFLSATDQAGRQIAISVPEDAVVLAPVDTASLTARAVAAARARKFPDAFRLMDQAIRSAPTDVVLPQTRSAIVELQISATKFAEAHAEQKKAVAEAARIRRNAGVTDQANRLDPTDTSNQTRAEKMREQATAVEQASRQNLTAAENQLRSAAERLSELQSESAANVSTAAVQTGTQASVAPSTSTAPAPQIAGSGKLALEPSIEKPETAPSLPKQQLSAEQISKRLRSWDRRVLERFEFDGLKIGISVETVKIEHPEAKKLFGTEKTSGLGLLFCSTKNADEVAISTVGDTVRAISIKWSFDTFPKKELPAFGLKLVFKLGRKPDRKGKGGELRWVFPEISRAVESGVANNKVFIAVYDLSEPATRQLWEKDDGGAFVTDKEGKSGLTNESGGTVSKDLNTYRSMAETGVPEAQYNLGLCYLKGEGVEEDFNQAVKWLRKAAEQGLAEAQYNLGICYSNGKGVDLNEKEGMNWFRKAADQGNADGESCVAIAYAGGKGVEKNIKEAIFWFQKAAGHGNAIAQCILGETYSQGLDLPKDDLKAAQLFRQSAEQGYGDAQRNLGLCFATGRGVDRDDVKAYTWLFLASRQNASNANAGLKLLGQRMDNAQTTAAKREASSFIPRTKSSYMNLTKGN
jgi:TPR repeat protein